jgi:hypothetical protein
MNAHKPAHALFVVIVAAFVIAACSGDYGPPIPASGRLRDGGEERDARPTDAAMSFVIDASSRFRSDAFFINDPAPPMCGPDGKMTPPPKVEGSADCPKDKNREGCECPKAGEEAPCWPGKRINRNHGICVDGKTRCTQTAEFGLAWGACEGYVLPKEGALQGPEACRCFSKGKWELSNLVPCIVEDAENSATYLYSSQPDSAGGYSCGSITELPPPAPSAIWSTSRLNVDCAGQFELCYTLKAGRAGAPRADDCTLTRRCFDVWYDQAGRTQNLPDLPGWVATDTTCAERFKSVGGYGEMSVRGLSEECEAVDDGNDKAYVFERTTYCKPDCNETPTADECRDCSVSGAGDF